MGRCMVKMPSVDILVASLLVMLLMTPPGSSAKPLKVGFYRKSCRSVERIVRQAVDKAVATNPGIAAGLIHLLFNDCFVRGCDASVLLKSTSPDKPSEQEHRANNGTLRGFEAINEAKAKLEALCPNTVSCADILAFAARDASNSVGGISYAVAGGRRDGTVGLHSEVKNNLPPPVPDLNIIIDAFAHKGMSILEMVALSGSHSIGVAHCRVFSNRLYKFNETHPQDPSLDPKYASFLKKKCPTMASNDPNNLDVTTPNLLDGQYYVNLKKNKGLLSSDQVLASNPLTANTVKKYIADSTLWAADFAAAMVHMGTLDVLTGTAGQIRRNCSVVN